MKLLLVGIVSVTLVYGLVNPWVAVSAYYMLAILGPQYIWYWIFDGMSISFSLAVVSLLATVINAISSRLKNKITCLLEGINFYVLLLLVATIVSFYFGKYVSYYDPKWGLSPQYLMVLMIKVTVMYWCGVLVTDNERRVICLACVLIVATIYMIYWANMQYLMGNWNQFSYGRLKGPESPSGGSIYRDENTFAMLFVTGIPFVYYLGMTLKSKIMKLGTLLIVVFGWHAIFLTGSRGGLVGVILTLVIGLIRSKKKWLFVVVIPLFLLFYIDQAGDTMRERGASIHSAAVEDRSAGMRLEAWKGGVKMILQHPVVGVGVGSFVSALPELTDSSPRVAHNTLIQFTAESGLLAGLSYIMIVVMFVKNNLVSAGVLSCKKNESKQNLLLRSVNDASLTAFIGLFCCSMFLSVSGYEVFYYLIIINTSIYTIVTRRNDC